MAAVRLRLGVNHVTISPTSRRRAQVGYCRTQHNLAGMRLYVAWPALVKADIMQSWAGYFAAVRAGYYEPFARLGARGDIEKITESNAEFRSVIRGRGAAWRRESRRLVQRYWPAIEAVAEALLKHKTLDGSEVVELVKPWIKADALPSPPGLTWQQFAARRNRAWATQGIHRPRRMATGDHASHEVVP